MYDLSSEMNDMSTQFRLIATKSSPADSENSSGRDSSPSSRSGRMPAAAAAAESSSVARRNEASADPASRLLSSQMRSETWRVKM